MVNRAHRGKWGIATFREEREKYLMKKFGNKFGKKGVRDHNDEVPAWNACVNKGKK